MSTQCWYCRGYIQLGATICPHCRSPINPGGGPVDSDFQRSANKWILILLVLWGVYELFAWIGRSLIRLVS